jgi:alkylation response protein AidB-like acyl-CoA dehydrogenase
LQLDTRVDAPRPAGDRVAVIEFRLEPELELLRDTARHFAEAQLRPHDRVHEAARGVDAAARRAYAEIGLAGAGLGALARSLVLEELAAADAGATIALDPLGAAFHALAECGEEAGLRTWAAPLLERDGARAIVVWNGARGIEVAGGRASGFAPWVPADRADLVVLLDTDSVAVLDAGFTLAPLRGAGLRAAGASELRLEGAPVRDFWVHPAGARRALARARLDAASLLLGVMRAAADYARAYAQERVAFGRPITHHQALAFLIADMAMAVEGTRLVVYEAALRLDTGADAAEACASAFLEAAEQAVFVAPNAVQILGGHGFMQDYPVEKWMREARTLGLLLGGGDAAREDAGRALALDEAPLALVEGSA